MAFTYAAFVTQETAADAQAYPITDNNMLPALVLWAAVTTNLRQRYPNYLDNVTESDKHALAEALGVTYNTVKQIFDLPLQGNNLAAFQTVADAFDNIARIGDGPYSHLGCPDSIEPLLALAKAGARVAEPGKGVHAVPRPPATSQEPMSEDEGTPHA